MQRGGQLIAVLAVAMCTVAVVPEQVRACSCNPEPLYATIPKAGAGDVPVDVAPVLEGPFDASSLSFSDDQGKAVEFTLALGPQVGCLGGWAELLPKQRLAPHTRYTIKVNALHPEALGAAQRSASLSFTTGDTELADEPLDRPQLSAASVMRGAPDCGGVPVVLACLGRVKPAEPSRVELLMRRGDEILLRTTRFIQSDAAFGIEKVPECIELRRRAIDGRRSEPVTICGDALPVSDYTSTGKSTNGWLTCRDGVIEDAAESGASDAGAAPVVSMQDAGIAASAEPDAAVPSRPRSSASDDTNPAPSSAAGCTVAANAPVDLSLLLALSLTLTTAWRRRTAGGVAQTQLPRRCRRSTST